MMKERPILFSTIMVEALIAGRKTQTRRIVKPQPNEDVDFGIGEFNKAIIDRHGDLQEGPLVFGAIADDGELCVQCPYGRPGDILYVRESFYAFGYWEWDGVSLTTTGKQEMCFVDKTIDLNMQYRYTEAPPNAPILSISDGGYGWYKRNSLFMPKAASRIWLQVEHLRVEHLQDISEEDAIAEGVQENICDDPSKCPSMAKGDTCCGKGEYFRYPVDFDDEPCSSAYESFMTLWQHINGKESWVANPWLWAVTLNLLSITGRPVIAEREAARK